MRAPRIALGENGEDPALRWYEVNEVASGRGGEVRVELGGIETREAAAALAGLLVLGDPSHFETLPAGDNPVGQSRDCLLVQRNEHVAVDSQTFLHRQT